MQRRSVKKWLAIATTMTLVSGILGGCGTTSTEPIGEAPVDNGEPDSAAVAAENDTEEEEQVTLTYFAQHLGNSITSFNDNYAYQKAQEDTGINIEFINAAAGSYDEQLSLMIASRDLPDIVEYFTYAKGPEQAIADGVIIKLNDLVDEYAPDYSRVLDEMDGEVRKQVTTDEGTIWSFACVQPKEEPSWFGLSIRKDLLDQLNMDVPETMEEWEAVLEGFKSLGIEAPLILRFDNGGDDRFTRLGQFVSAYGVGPSFYLDGDVVKYGPMEDGYKEFLTTMNRWYKNGLIDKDSFTREGTDYESMIITGQVGASANGQGPTLRYNTLGKENVGEQFELVPVSNPSLIKGELPHYRQKNFYYKANDTVITTNCENPEKAAMFLNYGYTDEGKMTYNYGVEGISYTMVDGEPQWTEDILNDERGWTYIRDEYKVHVGAYDRDWEAAPITDFERECLDVWSRPESDMVMPIVSLTAQESSRYGEIMTDMDTYVNEMRLKFITGQESLDNYDSFREQLVKMGVEEVVQIENDAYQRYLNR